MYRLLFIFVLLTVISIFALTSQKTSTPELHEIFDRTKHIGSKVPLDEEFRQVLILSLEVEDVEDDTVK
jgi:hypothetical protein